MMPAMRMNFFEERSAVRARSSCSPYVVQYPPLFSRVLGAPLLQALPIDFKLTLGFLALRPKPRPAC
jgi:hypothetical protein